MLIGLVIRRLRGWPYFVEIDIHAISCWQKSVDLANFLGRFDEILWDFYENHFQAYISKLKAIILIIEAWDSHANVWFISSSSKNSLLNGMKILWDLKILWETGSRKAKILWDFVSQCEVWHVWIDHEIFSTVILSLPLIQEGQLSVSGKRMCTILVNRLGD